MDFLVLKVSMELKKPWFLCKCGVLSYESEICKPCKLKNNHLKNDNILSINDIKVKYIYKGSIYYINNFFRKFFK